jgi:TolB-like protein/DNA-binding winged helix-turn-helix (wHTH) protein/tetratricopeptide (TPR) repeat protein
MPGSERYAFGDFVLERSQRRVLRRDGTALGLTSRQFDALLLFVENAGQLLDKDTLLRALWPALVVEENNLSQTVSSLRRSLGDEPPGKRYIQTVARRGFRFIAPVTIDPPVAGPAPPTSSLATGGDEAAATPSQTTVAARRRWLRLAVACASAAIAGAAVWGWRRAATGGAGEATAGATLAVLPFKPLAAESRDELLEVGMADSLITRLSIVPGLVVRSVGSVRRYAGSEQDPVRAAQELDVVWIVDGSLQRRGDQLRVNARLLRARDGTAAWSGSFDEKFTGVFDVQDAISARVLQALVGRLQSGAGVVAGVPGTDLGGTRNTDAYEFYLAASRHAQGRRAEGLRKSIALYHQALATDPSYALAHVGLAETLRETMLASDALPASVSEPARAAIKRALTLTPNLGEALAEKGYSLYFFEFDWPGAEREFRRALSFNPNVAVAQFGLAQLLLTQDRPAEGFVHLRRARELDPMSPFFNTLEAGYLFASGRREEAHARLQRAFDIAPDFFLALRTLATMQLAEGQPERAIALLRRAVTHAEGNSRPRAFLGMHLVRLGHRDEAREILNQLLGQAATGYVPAFSLAVLYAALDDKAKAFDALEQAYAAHDPQIVFLKDDPRWSGLRQEPRYAALMRVMKLDRYGPGLSPS